MRAILFIFVSCLAWGQSCSQTFTTANVGTSPFPGSNVETAVAGGTTSTVLCFASGNYGAIDLYGAHPTGTGQLTITPASGASVTGISFNMNGVSKVLITGFCSSSVRNSSPFAGSCPTSGTSSLDGGVLVQVSGQGNNSNITIQYNDMPTAGVNVQNNALANAAILIQNNTFIGYVSSGEQDRVLIQSNNSCPNGITIQNNEMGGGESDGIDISGSSCQTQVLNNYIHGIIESNCGGIHCDGIQDNGGGNGTHIKGNFFANDSDCFLFDDGTSNYLLEDNVCQTAGASSYWMQFGGAATITLNHNTVTSTAGAQYGNDHAGNPSSNITLTNNIFTTQLTQNSGQPPTGVTTIDYNLCPSGCTGTHSINGTPTYAGGATPTTYAGFTLTGGSTGHNAGNDGMDIGINIASSSSNAGAVRGGNFVSGGNALN